MTLPRSVLIDPSCTTFYHCTSRCVRRAFLCGRDAVTGYNFEHRRSWLEARLLTLANIFAIDLCAYAVMSNHYHVVLRIDTKRQNDWDAHEIIDRYGRIHKVPDWLETADQNRVAKTIELWRERLGSISWFMKCVNEPLARIANQEDGCRGRFWEGRFKSQALLDNDSILKCMAYVDLNPIRAQIATTPERSVHTSIRARINGHDQSLAPFADEAKPTTFSLPISKAEYFLLVDYTGRQLRSDKAGQIPATMPPIVERLSRSCHGSWLDEMSGLTRRYFRAIGNFLSLADYRDSLGQMKLRGLRA